MTRDDIIRMASEAGVREAVLLGGYGSTSFLSDEEIERLNRVLHFAALVAAAEREVCAKLCDEEASRMEEGAQRAIENDEHDEVSAIRSTAWKLSVTANRIRARGDQ